MVAANTNSNLKTRIPWRGVLGSRTSLWRRRMATIASGSLALVMGYGVIFGHNGLTAFAHKQEEARFLHVQMQQLQRENERLQGHVERLNSDPSAIEHEAREDMHYTRTGEVIVTLPAVPNDVGKTQPQIQR
jgi:cell division protein FtsB